MAERDATAKHAASARQIGDGPRLWSLLTAFHPFDLLNVVLVFLIIYLGGHGWQFVRKARWTPQTQAVEPLPARGPTPPSTTMRPLADYKIISQRNLFAPLKGEAPPPGQMVNPGKRPTREPGLRLVGTILAKDARGSLAFVRIENTGKEDLYHEGDRIGQARIKKILRDRVIIKAGDGDMVLGLWPDYRGGDPSGSPAAGRTTDSAAGPVQLGRQEIESTLPDYMQLVKTVSLRPHFERGRPGGFLLYNIQPESIFGKMGLENGDVITAVNGEPTMLTRQAEDFYNALVEGGKVTVQVKRGETTQELRLDIY